MGKIEWAAIDLAKESQHREEKENGFCSDGHSLQLATNGESTSTSNKWEGLLMSQRVPQCWRMLLKREDSLRLRPRFIRRKQRTWRVMMIPWRLKIPCRWARRKELNRLFEDLLSESLLLFFFFLLSNVLRLCHENYMYELRILWWINYSGCWSIYLEQYPLSSANSKRKQYSAFTDSVIFCVFTYCKGYLSFGKKSVLCYAYPKEKCNKWHAQGSSNTVLTFSKQIHGVSIAMLLVDQQLIRSLTLHT